MKFMLLVQASEVDGSGGGETAAADAATAGNDAMATFDDRLIRAGVLLAAESLDDDTTPARVTYGRETAAVSDGSFADAPTPISRFWILQVASRDEAIWWAKSVPLDSGVVEVRRVREPYVDRRSTPLYHESDPVGQASGKRTA